MIESGEKLRIGSTKAHFEHRQQCQGTISGAPRHNLGNAPTPNEALELSNNKGSTPMVESARMDIKGSTSTLESARMDIKGSAPTLLRSAAALHSGPQIQKFTNSALMKPT